VFFGSRVGIINIQSTFDKKPLNETGASDLCHYHPN
jgi:hypothetical protein